MLKGLPEWWEWELSFSSELPDRMRDRQFNEPDLRMMLADATEWELDKEPGRFIVWGRRGNERWEVIVEPDLRTRLLVIVTAFRVR
jgi:hypothetical protein